MTPLAYVAIFVGTLAVLFIISRVLKGRADAKTHAAFEEQQKVQTPAPSPAPAAAPAEEDNSVTLQNEEEEMPTTVESLVNEGNDLFATCEHGDARDKYSEALDLAREKYNAKDPALAAVLLKYAEADLAYDGNEYDEDTIPDEYLEALSILDQAHGCLSEKTLPALEGLVAFYDRVGAHNKSAGIISRIASVKAAAKLAAAEAPPAPPKAE